jgi:hypothetical protein
MPEPIYQPPVNIMDTPAPQTNGGGGIFGGGVPNPIDSASEDEAKLVNQAAYFF